MAIKYPGGSGATLFVTILRKTAVIKSSRRLAPPKPRISLHFAAAGLLKKNLECGMKYTLNSARQLPPGIAEPGKCKCNYNFVIERKTDGICRAARLKEGMAEACREPQDHTDVGNYICLSKPVGTFFQSPGVVPVLPAGPSFRSPG
jgi:hypothetical protein